MLSWLYWYVIFWLWCRFYPDDDGSHWSGSETAGQIDTRTLVHWLLIVFLSRLMFAYSLFTDFLLFLFKNTVHYRSDTGNRNSLPFWMCNRSVILQIENCNIKVEYSDFVPVLHFVCYLVCSSFIEKWLNMLMLHWYVQCNETIFSFDSHKDACCKTEVWSSINISLFVVGWFTVWCAARPTT